LQDNSTEKYFELLDGDKIVQKDKEFLGSFDRNVYGSPSNGKDKDIYRVEVKVEKDVNFQYENIDNLDKYNDVGFRLNFTSNKINDANITANKLIMELDQNLKKLVVSNENEATPILTIEKTDINKNIILDIRNDFYKDVNIEFINKSEEFVEIYMIKDGNNPSKMKLYSSSGNVILYEENKEEENKIGDMYNYTVTVKDKRNNLLFQGTSNNNVNIKLK
ncbi:MAG: prepilin-type cleavage/methylation domain-containing protein, partial [Clostridium sp.]|uniref:prepilin-type cleavage/methylation domain-containing protein n=1 Tax=Clostridium sp. TaxID=1506 RepID=UPI0025B8B52A